MKTTWLCCFLLLGYSSLLNAKDYALSSPDGKLKMTLQVKEDLSLSIQHENDEVVQSVKLAMRLAVPNKKGKIDTVVWGQASQVSKARLSSKNEQIHAPVYKREKVLNQYNELEIRFKQNYSLQLRAYNDGGAYRFVGGLDSELTVLEELAEFNFGRDYSSIMAFSNSKKTAIEDQYFCSFENTYNREVLTKQKAARLAFLPVMIELDKGKKLNITEVNLEDYPGMFLRPQNQSMLKAVMAPLPDKTKQGGHNQIQRIVESRHAHIARTTGNRSFPWRVFGVSVEDAQMACSDLVYKLADPSRVVDPSWIHPGKVAWDWWNAWNLEGVSFKTGVNNDTYKYYIDFAAKNGIEYVILDEGFNVNLKADLLEVIPEIDLKFLIDYAASKQVGIILWAGYWAFNRDMEKVVKHYAQMGVKGFKVDFLDADDQDMVRFVYRAAKVAAEHKMMLDFHGIYKPTGLQRTYPNVVNFEGVHGLEQLKWSPIEKTDMPLNDVLVPYIRMFAGPLDYTQGAMRNATRKNFRPIHSEPMSQGTRAHQLALYMIYESPLNMLCDAPTNYEKEPLCTDFIAAVPTVWDESHPICGEVGEYLGMARRKGDQWYIGVITNWSARKLTLDLDFLGEGKYRMKIIKDGVNADKRATDYAVQLQTLPQSRLVEIEMAPGGGWAAVLEKAL